MDLEADIGMGQAGQLARQRRVEGETEADPGDGLGRADGHDDELIGALVDEPEADRLAGVECLVEQAPRREGLARLQPVQRAHAHAFIHAQDHAHVGIDARGVIAQRRAHRGAVAGRQGALEAEIGGEHAHALQQLLRA